MRLFNKKGGALNLGEALKIAEQFTVLLEEIRGDF